MKFQHRLILLFVFLVLQACSTVEGPVHFYSGSPRADTETARLKVPAPITVVAIDGREVEVPSKEEGFYEIYLLPGVHRVDFKYELSWGDNVSGMLVKSDVVGVESQFFTGKHYELSYPVPTDQEEAYTMARKFSAQLLETETGRQVGSRPVAELNEFRTKTSFALSDEAVSPAPAPVPTPKKDVVTAPTGITADTAVHEDAVKRLKFWWLMANEEEQAQFKKWMQSVERPETK